MRHALEREAAELERSRVNLEADSQAVKERERENRLTKRSTPAQTSDEPMRLFGDRERNKPLPLSDMELSDSDSSDCLGRLEYAVDPATGASLQLVDSFVFVCAHYSLIKSLFCVAH